MGIRKEHFFLSRSLDTVRCVGVPERSTDYKSAIAEMLFPSIYNALGLLHRKH